MQNTELQYQIESILPALFNLTGQRRVVEDGRCAAELLLRVTDAIAAGKVTVAMAKLTGQAGALSECSSASI